MTTNTMAEEKTQLPELQEHLLEERKELMERTIKLGKFLTDPDAKLNHEEWKMLENQYFHMKEYLQILTTRCVYYGLLEAVNLHLDYSKR